MRTYNIYQLNNKINNKRYIGLSKNPKRRMRKHRIAKSVIGFAIRKYGWENFTVLILESGLTLQQAAKRERFLIKKHNCIAPNGYNLNAGGEGQFNPSAETRIKLSKASTGRHHSIETRAKLSKASIGQHHSAETRAKLSKAKKDRGKGIKLSAEACANMRRAQNQPKIVLKH